MSVLEDFQFELDGIPFGIGLPIAVDGDGFDPGTLGIENQDQEQPNGDAITFGRDFFSGGPTWAWTLHTDKAETPEQALADVRALARAWRGEGTRQVGGRFLWLRYRVAGRTRRLPGRPRNWAAPTNNNILSGLMPITCDFRAAVPYTFGDAQRDTTISVMPATVGGLKAPLIAPLSTLSGGTREGTLTADEVGGEAPTPFILHIHGPINHPFVSGNDWKIDIPYDVAYDETISVQTFPWALGATSSNGNLVPLNPKTRLSTARLDPAGINLIFGGTDMTGTASCDLQWYPAYYDW